MNEKVGIYTRVSSDSQVLEGHSLQWQEYNLVQYAKEHNLNIVDKYVEKGISGETIEKRPELKRLIEDVKSGKINHVLVYKIDRLGRYVKTNSDICKILVENNCSLTSSVYGFIQLKTASGALMYNMLSAVSQFEVNNLSERVINGKKQRVRNGLYANSYNVYGYDNYYDGFHGDRLLKINEFESQIIKEIFNSYLNGMSMNKIANDLNIRKIPTKRGGSWSQSTIFQMLSNKLYIGFVIYRGTAKKEYFENKGVHSPIIDEDVFYKVQEIIQKRHEKKAKKISNEYSYFSSVLISDDNKSQFKPKQTKAKDKLSIRYYCKNKDSNISSIKHIELEKMFANELKEIKLKYNNKIINNIFKNDDYEMVLKLINKIKLEQNKLFDFLSNDIISEDIFKERIEKINIKKQALQKQENELKTKIIDNNDKMKNKILEMLNDSLMNNFLNLKENEKMNFINLFVENIEISESHKINIIWKNKKAMN